MSTFSRTRFPLSLAAAALAMGTLFGGGITRAAAPAVPAAATTSAAPIDRHALVTRHNLTWNDPAKHLALGAMPYRNSVRDGVDGVIDGSVAVGVLSQSRPTAHRLAQRPLAR